MPPVCHKKENHIVRNSILAIEGILIKYKNIITLDHHVEIKLRFLLIEQAYKNLYYKTFINNKTGVKGYIWNVYLALNILANAITGGAERETLSCRINKVSKLNDGNIPWSRPLMKIIYWGVDKLDPGHFKN